MPSSYLISILLHLAFFLSVLFLSPIEIEKKSEPITIDVVSDPSPIKVAAAPIQSIAPAAAQLETATSEAPRIEKTSSKKSSVKASPRVAQRQAPPAQRSQVPATIDDISTNDLDYDNVQVVASATLKDEDLDQTFNQVDKKQKSIIDSSTDNLENEVNNLNSDLENQLSQQEADSRAELNHISGQVEALKSANAAALAAARARGAAEAAARAKNKTGAGGNGVALNGSPTGEVRAIGNLRQLSGNPKPEYSMEERFQKQQGTVVFQAFVTDEGKLKDFKLIQSTGYKSLDGKTLAALKKWRFYPGQQGWVEIPQTWSLKGDSEQMPTMLRRKISQR